MTGNKAENDEWKDKEDVILNLYIVKKLSLSKYEEIFIQNKICKNVKAKEWKHIVRKVARRKAQQKKSNVRVRGMELSANKVSKAMKAYEPTTFERHFDERSPTPDGIVIITPVSYPSPQAVSMVPLQRRTSCAVNRTIEAVPVPSETRTPFHEVIDFVHQESFRRQNCLPSPVVEASSTIRLLGINAADPTEDAFRNQQLLNVPIVNGAIIGSLFNFNYPVHPVHFNSHPYLPPHIDIIRFDITGRNAYLEFLKHIIFVVSNNIDVELVDKLAIKLAKDANARDLFACLIGHNLTSLKICIE